MSIKEQENILILYWQHYVKCLELTHISECDDQEFIENKTSTMDAIFNYSNT